MNIKVWAPLGLALAMGVVAAKVGYDMVSRGQRVAKPTTQTTGIVVAARPIKPGSAIVDQDLALRQVAGDLALPGSFASTGEVVGRIAALEVSKDQLLSESFLVAKGAGAGAQALVPDGMRAIAIEINEFSGVAGLLLPGCRVDVVTSLREDTGKMSRTVVQNVRVLAVGQSFSPVPEPQVVDPNAPPKPPIRSVTLLVSPSQAEAIDLATTAGRPRLVLRGTFDNEQADSRGVTLAELVGGPRPAAPTTAPANPDIRIVQATTRPANLDSRYSITVIRGTKESKVDLSATTPVSNTALGNTDTGLVNPER